ncbi:MAG: hypothetical protein KAS66_07535 [Candidatus Omnitrophica bacterium]|nr:hypothetical protein [Candidatus Omnitrophota bacterium]
MPKIQIDEKEILVTVGPKIVSPNGQISVGRENAGKTVKMYVVEVTKSTINLCRNCNHEFAECNGTPCFGNGKGNDNVYDCDEFVLLEGKSKW